MKLVMLRGAMLLGLWLLGLTSSLMAADAAKLRVLFLGDHGHHEPHSRAIQLMPVMQRAGIEIQYTDDLAQLTLPNLKKFDALLVYANIDNLDDAPAEAILQYVAQGGGYLPIHCASFCFRNQPKLVELCGAQFSKHGTGDFTTRVRADDHPIMAGLMPFATWDETYEHIKHNDKDRVVLQTRDDNGHSEPWTWIRTHAEGRVFYTAYGHDHRTWENPGFHALIERGIRWVTRQKEITDSMPNQPQQPRNLNLPPMKAKACQIIDTAKALAAQSTRFKSRYHHRDLSNASVCRADSKPKPL